jgi:hypothetical protein
MAVELHDLLPQFESAQVNIQINVSAKINLTATIARRKVNVFLLNEVSTGLGGDAPDLIVQNDRVCWRVPVILALPSRGRLGQVGQIDIDAQSGELLISSQIIDEIRQHANRLATGSAD